MKRIGHLAGAMAIAAFALSAPAGADDLVKMTIGQRGNWDTAVTHLGEKAGIFKKHGISMEMVYTRGSGETVQPVISGNVDLGLAVGTLGAIKEFNLDVKPVATGGPPATLTAVMSNQVDIGWAAPPFGLKEIDEGKIRLVARGRDTKIIGGQTIRVIIANAELLKTRHDVLRRFMQAYRETVDYMYSDDPKVMTDYAEFAGITPAMAKRVRDEFFPKSLMQMTEIKGLDQMLVDAVELKYAPKPLTKEQVGELVQTDIAK